MVFAPATEGSGRGARHSASGLFWKKVRILFKRHSLVKKLNKFMKYLQNKNYALKHIFVIPIVSTLIIPLVIMDIWIEIYHRLCFPLCKLQYVERGKYIKIDRFKLKYLTFFQKCIAFIVDMVMV